MDAPGFREVSKAEFKAIYFRLGGGARSGWTAEYWQTHLEPGGEPDWRYLVEDPRSPAHDAMWIVSDSHAKEHRLFFMSEESTENVFDHPGKE